MYTYIPASRCSPPIETSGRGVRDWRPDRLVQASERRMLLHYSPNRSEHRQLLRPENPQQNVGLDCQRMRRQIALRLKSKCYFSKLLQAAKSTSAYLAHKSC